MGMNKNSGFTLGALSPQKSSPLLGGIEGGCLSNYKPSPSPSLREGSFKQGFTLVELSIVLVIIGLLIGGILVAQSLIETAEIQSQVRQIQQFDAAISNFRVKYNSLPGDTDRLTPSGDKNTRIESTGGDDNYFTGEIAAFWNHLSQTELTEQYSTTVSPGIMVETNVPKLAMGRANAGILVGSPNEPANAFQNENVYWLTGLTTTGGSTNGGACAPDCGFYPYTPTQAMAIDKKMDDGLPAAGYVRGAKIYEFDSPAYTNCASSTAYVVTNSDYLCSLIIKILAASDG